MVFIEDLNLSRTKLKTREKIIKTANKLFRKQGIEATSIAEIALAAKVTRPTVYAYFETKRDLAVAALHVNMNKLYENLIIYEEEETTPLANIALVFKRSLECYFANPEIMKYLVEYYRVFSKHNDAEENKFLELPNVKRVVVYRDRYLEMIESETSLDERIRTYTTVFNYNIAIGMRYALRHDQFLGHDIISTKEDLFLGLDKLVEIIK